MLIISFIVFIFSCSKTNTPKEYLNKTVIESRVYFKDKALLEKKLTKMVNSDSSLLPHNKSLKYLESYIDTIFYGTSGKIAFLGVTKRKNENLKFFPDKYKDGIEYYGSGFIGMKRDSNNLEIINNLYYHVSQSVDYEGASESLRQIYFNKMQLRKGEKVYNMNDIRFWGCPIWVYPDGRPVD
jgi:hypothetical protein